MPLLNGNFPTLNITDRYLMIIDQKFMETKLRIDIGVFIFN